MEDQPLVRISHVTDPAISGFRGMFQLGALLGLPSHDLRFSGQRGPEILKSIPGTPVNRTDEAVSFCLAARDLSSRVRC